MADGKEAEGGEDSIERNIDNLMPTFENLDPNYQDILDQCDSLRRSNLQLREEILRLERENAELKRQTLREKLNGYVLTTYLHLNHYSNFILIRLYACYFVTLSKDVLRDGPCNSYSKPFS